MLKRLYIHNYKCLVNFEIDFDKDVSLFLGGNGSGKTSVLSALYEVQQFILKNDRLDDKDNDIFKTSSLTRWTDDVIQKFELDIEGNGGIYKYALEIEHFPEKKLLRVKTESLLFDSQPLFKFSIDYENGEAVGNGRLFNDSQSSQEGIFYPIDWFRSGLGTVQERHDNRLLSWFKNWLRGLFIAQIIPVTMSFDIERNEPHPEPTLSNFAAWLSYWNNENREGISAVEEELREIIDGFKIFRFAQFGAKTILELKINKYFYRFDELSDGQKALAALYTLVYCVPENSTICIDEPENFLALPEIQPWLNILHEQVAERKLQVLLISHHPSLINFLASDAGHWFAREQDYHTRIENITKQDEDGLSLAELIELGWVYGD